MAELIRVAVVAPNPAMRIGLRELLARSPDIDVVAEAANIASLQVSDEDTDVLVLASVVPSQLGDQLQRWHAVLLLASDSADVEALATGRVTATGCLPADATEAELAAAVHALAQGLWVGSPSLLQSIAASSARRWTSKEDMPIDPLTARETEVLQQIALGLANRQIAVALGISEHTVKFHLSSLYAKLGVGSRTEAVRAGLNLALISL